jgi:D-3-phosphoglycerate dehydrogenase
MNKKFSISVPIRSMDRNGEAYRTLAERFHIVFTNTSGKRLEGEDLIRALANADGVIAGTEPYSADILDASPRLKVISRVGAGTDAIDIVRAKERGITIKNTPDAPVAAVAEHTLALMLSAIKHIPAYDRQIRNGEYSVRTGSTLAGKTVGIIGAGRIGRRVGALTECLGCRIIWHDPWCRDELPGSWVQKARLEDLLAEADIITIHAAAQENQKPILDQNSLSLCRNGVIIINTARASFIDEKALENALTTGRVSAACLDVQAKEPYDGPLLRSGNVIITPHVASNTLESRRQMEMEAVKNLADALEATTK